MSGSEAGKDNGGGLPRSVVLLTLAATLLRLMLFVGRGSYVAFDEGWYLLLGRNLWSGDGYTLSGLQHVALSPLFPVLAGGVGWILGDPIWGGRIVAGLTSGLLVLPCWSIFRRLAPQGVALTGALFVAVIPSLAPFVVPYWIGWDLWVGAEPVLHLFLFTGIALFLKTWEEGGWVWGLGSGAAFALAYLARPEAIGTFAVLGLVAVGVAALGSRLRRIEAPRLAQLVPRAAVGALAFVVVAAPYWMYLRAELGRWAITGRAVQVMPERSATARSRGSGGGVNRIEEMLWRDDSGYVRRLYALDASGTRLANNYWGIRPAARDAPPPPVAGVPNVEASAGESLAQPAGSPSGAAESGDSSALVRYVQALGVAVPWYVWPLVLLGLLSPARARRLDLEVLVGVPLVATSVLIVRIVAIDPRTQLFLAPWLAFYAAVGALALAARISRRFQGRVRPGLASWALVGGLALTLLGTSFTRLGLSLAFGSPHHIVAAENATVGAAIRRESPTDATVVSFHPALALFADRDWRVLPMEPLERIVRYVRTQPTPYLVHSVFYPPELRPLEEPHYLVVPIPSDLPDGRGWLIGIPARDTVYAFGELIPRE